MPSWDWKEWAGGLLVIAYLGFSIFSAFTSGKVQTPFGSFNRVDEPELFYCNVGALAIPVVGVLFLILMQVGVIPDFIYR